MSLKWHGDEIVARLKRGIMRGVIDGTGIVHQTMVQKIMEPPKTGRIYRRNGVDHQASAPGESPANDTGNLVKSMREVFDHENLTGTVVVGTDYAKRLEYGFTGVDAAGRMVDQAPRPYVRPTLAEKANEVRDAIIQHAARELK